MNSLMSSVGEARGIDAWLAIVGAQIWTVLLRVTLLALLIAAADYTYNRFKNMKQLKMTKQEVKQESKDTEGDPLLRARRRSKQAEMSRNRMILDATSADVVITNPTHFAVALKYTMGEPAPRVVAKGTGRLAKKIKKLAYRHGVMVQQDPPLARAIYRRCKVGAFVPATLFEAVAVILAVAYRRRRRGVA
jgi:flagellar biosynthetic protein FlhB